MCTNLMINVPTTPGQAEPQTHVSARCMEMPGRTESSLYVVPAGQPFPLPVAGGSKSFVPPFVDAGQQAQWIGAYGFVGVATPSSSSAPPFFCDGMNSEGLSAAALWLAPGTNYPLAPASPTAQSPGEVSYLDFVAWLLSNFASVQLAQAELEGGTISIVGPPQELDGVADPWYEPLHFVVTDNTGASMIVEFVDGEGPTIYQSSNAVLTNTPTYDWHLTNIDNYFNLTLIGQATSASGASNPVGGGLVGLPGDSLSASRFVRAWVLSAGLNANGGLLPPAIGAGVGHLPSDGTGWLPAPGATPPGVQPVVPTGFSGPEQTAVTSALQLVQACMGTPYAMLQQVQATGGVQTTYGDYTQWTSVRDHTNANYYVMPVFNAILTRVSLAECADAPLYADGWLTIPVMPAAPDAPWAVDGNPVSATAAAAAPAAAL
jgi:choloylglycine hydrolase